MDNLLCVDHRKMSSHADIYIYIYMCVCVCVCVLGTLVPRVFDFQSGSYTN